MCVHGENDLATLLRRVFEGIPSGDSFWSRISEEDVKLAALRAYALLSSKRDPGREDG